MDAEKVDGGYRAYCPTCKTLTLFRSTDNRGNGYSSFSRDLKDPVKKKINDQDAIYNRVISTSCECTGCRRGGMAESYHSSKNQSELIDFYPYELKHKELPESLPREIRKEFKEAEICYGHKAYRASSAMARSTLEKVLKLSGYEDVDDNTGYDRMGLKKKIEEATSDHILTKAREKQVHDDIKVLGDEVVHRPWREISKEEVESSLKYVLWIIHDLYDDRSTVEAELQRLGRLPS